MMRVSRGGGRMGSVVQARPARPGTGAWRRMISALTLLRTEDTYQSRDKWSYVLLAEEVRRVCAAPAQNAAELFRRMCFNALISNIDDHPA